MRERKHLTGVLYSSKIAQDKSLEFPVGPQEVVVASNAIDVSVLMRQNFKIPLASASLNSLFWLVESVEGFCIGILVGQPSRRTP
jgi:hypothetical protein